MKFVALSLAVSFAAIGHASFEMMLIADNTNGVIHRYDPVNRVYLGSCGQGSLLPVTSMALDQTNGRAFVKQGTFLTAFNYSTGDALFSASSALGAIAYRENFGDLITSTSAGLTRATVTLTGFGTPSTYSSSFPSAAQITSNGSDVFLANPAGNIIKYSGSLTATTSVVSPANSSMTGDTIAGMMTSQSGALSFALSSTDRRYYVTNSAAGFNAPGTISTLTTTTAITRGRLDTREWQTLRRMGIATTGALADLEPEDPAFFDEYHPEVTQYSREQALKRLQAAVRQARMICDGVDFQPIASPAVAVPSADIEIDFDIEWDTAGRIYQWGLRVRDGQDDATARYQPVVSFEPLDDEGELALAERAAAIIAHLRGQADSSGRTVAVYHWSHPEVSMTRRFGCITAALDGLTVDLLAWFTGTFHVRGEASIKAVAQSLGFTWAVDDPGGRLSMAKIEIARGAGPEALGARQWCLDYNESDVAAQAAIRDGIRKLYGQT